MNYLKLERLSARRVTIDAMLKGKFVYVYNMTLNGILEDISKKNKNPITNLNHLL